MFWPRKRQTEVTGSRSKIARHFTNVCKSLWFPLSFSLKALSINLYKTKTYKAYYPPERNLFHLWSVTYVQALLSHTNSL